MNDNRKIVARIMICLFAFIWFLVGLFWDKIEVVGIVALGLPLLGCLLATFFSISITRTTQSTAGSWVAAALVNLILLIGLCGYMD